MPLFTQHRNNEAVRRASHWGARKSRGFTLPEVMFTLVIVILMMVAVLEFMTTADRAWKSGAADPFAEAEEAFETVAKNLASATLDPYQDEANSSGAFRTNSTSSFTPDHPARRSDLAFVTGPSAGSSGLLANSGRTTTGDGLFFITPYGYTQTDAHTGMERLLNTLGYFVEFGPDETTPAFMVSGTSTWRWRLKQVLQPSESLQIFALSTSQAWIQQVISTESSTPVLADNVVTLLALPERAANDSGAAIATNYCYDSRDSSNALTRHQLPPRVLLAMVAIDEPSAQILASQNGTNAPSLVASTLFQNSTNFSADLATLDATLTTRKIEHRIFQRTVLLSAAAWSNTLSQ